MSDAREDVRNRIEGLSESEKLNILVVGTPGTEPAAFINSLEMSVTGEWPNLRADDSGGGEQDTPSCLNRFEMFPQIEGLSGKVACFGLSLQEKEEGDISALMSRVLEGRVPTGKPVFDMSETELEQKFGGVHTGVEIDMVVFLCSSNGTVPVEVMEDAKRGVDSARTSRNIPLFLFMVKQNNRPSTRAMDENKQKAQKLKALDIAEEFGFISQLYQKSNTGSDVSQKDAIDPPLLTFWNKILNVKNRSCQDEQQDLNHCPQWTKYLKAIRDFVSHYHVTLLLCMISLLLCMIIVLIVVQRVKERPEGGYITSAEELQVILVNSKLLHALNTSLESRMLNMTSEILVTLNTTFDNKVQEMKSELQNMTSKLQNTLNSTFHGRLEEMKSELQNMTSTLQNTLNSTFDRRLEEMKSEVLDILNSELSNQTTNLTNDFNTTLNNFKEDVNNTLKDMYTKLDNKLVDFSKKMNESTEILNNTLTTWNKTIDEKSLELNTTWERGLLCLKNETESIAVNLSTELDKKQATFHVKLEGVISTWESKQSRVIRVLGTLLQYWRGQFSEMFGTAKSKLLNTTRDLERTVASLNASVKNTEVPKEPVQQEYNKTIMARLMILYEQYPMQSLVIVAFACVAIPWLVCSQHNKRNSRRLQMAARRREGQVPGTYGDMSDDEGWLDENQQVCIVASLDWTLDEVERCVKTAVQERGLANTDVLTIRVSGQDDIDVLKRTLQRKTRVICCANSTTRNILLSDTEHDEISYVVKAAEKIVGGSGVMVLLYGHEKSRDIQQLYDSTSFDRAFLNKQTRLLNKAHRDNLFFSVFKSLNESQKHRLCDWIRGDM